MLEAFHKAQANAWGRMENKHSESHICGYAVYDEQGDGIGNVTDFVTDGQGRLRYLVIDTGLWIFGKKVLVPAGLAQVDDEGNQIILKDITREKVKDLPEYHEDMQLDETYERQVIDTFSTGSRQQEAKAGDHRSGDRIEVRPVGQERRSGDRDRRTKSKREDFAQSEGMQPIERTRNQQPMGEASEDTVTCFINYEEYDFFDTPERLKILEVECQPRQ